MQVYVPTGDTEIGTSLLPILLAGSCHFAYALGIEGVADGVSSFAKLAGGWVADRPHLRKPVAVAGLLTGLSTFAFGFVGSCLKLFVSRDWLDGARNSRAGARCFADGRGGAGISGACIWI